MAKNIWRDHRDELGESFVIKNLDEPNEEGKNELKVIENHIPAEFVQ